MSTRKRWIIDCGGGGPDYAWNPDSIKDGIGGSEECVIYLAQALANQNQEVIVINNCGTGMKAFTLPGDKNKEVLYMGNKMINNSPTRMALGSDIYVSWRSFQRAVDVKRASIKSRNSSDLPKFWLWCHDIPVGEHWDNQNPTKDIDTVVLLNEYHSSIYNTHEGQAFVCNIGVNLDHWTMQPGIQRIQGKCIYFSHPHRGLDRLRNLWPRIREVMPHATLQACWWQPEFFLPEVPELGILPMYSASHEELARLTLEADLFTYPSVFAPEISPASTIKAQIGGAIPVTINQGGMVDTVKFGKVCSNDDEFVIETLKYMAMTDQEKYSLRMAMIQDSEKRYDWDLVATNWINRAETR